jgi:molecular chaperone HtpG
MAVGAVQRLKNTILFQTLLKREGDHGGEHSLSELCTKQVEQAVPLLDRIPEKMPQFTLHDPNHSAKILDLIAQILPEETLAQLNQVELAILILAAYLHDIGMTCNSQQREEIIANESEFRALLMSDDSRAAAHLDALNANQHRIATRIEDQVFVEYLRRHHVDRSDKHIESLLPSLSWHGSPFGKWVRAVCWSHGEPISSLYDESDYPRDALVRNLRINVQYLAILLRLGDILDLDPERTPAALFDFISPTEEQSIVEWKKHRSIIGWDITPERVVFEAECTQPAYERALRTFIDWIETERRDSVLLLARHTDTTAKRYRLDLVHPVTADRVHSDGSYIYSSMRFEIDHKRVIALLGGVRLYKDPLLAIRELLQNSVDAVRHRFANDAAPELEPSITITLDGRTLIVEDNGIGMDEQIFRDYFIQLGRSFYTSTEFGADRSIDPVSEFGIGALASFMVATSIVVESRRLPGNPLLPPPPIRFEIPTSADFFIQRQSKRVAIGTKVSLTLRDDFELEFEKLCETVRSVAPMIEYPVTIVEGVNKLVIPAEAGVRAIDSNCFVTLQLPFADGILSCVDGVLGIRALDRRERHLSLSQRGFLIGEDVGTSHYTTSDDETIHDLVPAWTSIVGSINLRAEAKLTLTPDRRGAIQDEKFKKLKSAIDVALVNASRIKLQDMIVRLNSPTDFKAFTDDLMERGMLTADLYVEFSLRNYPDTGIGEFGLASENFGIVP